MNSDALSNNYPMIVDVLTNGFAKPVTDATGAIVGQELVPPNKYMLAAAKLIKHMAGLLERNQGHLNQLQNELNKARDELNRLKQVNV